MGKFTRTELIRYNRQMMLPEIGLEGQEKIKAARILVVGAGGLGCPTLLYLSAAGIGTIGIVDFDKVELHNLHRQILYTPENIGQSKAITAAAILQKQNPFTDFAVFDEVLTESNAEQILSGFDLILDGSDNFLTRYLVNDVCVQLGKPLISASILGFEGQFSVFNYQGGKNLRDLFPEPPNAEDVPNCDENGVLGSLPGILASMVAHEALKLVLGMAVLDNELVVFDTRNWNYVKLGY